MTEANEPAVFSSIRQVIADNNVVLFMKGSAEMPQCGFSATVVRIMELTETAFKDVNVMVDPEIRQGIKDFSEWPTIPQLYVKGEFIGGCDIIREMYESGELQPILAKTA